MTTETNEPRSGPNKAGEDAARVSDRVKREAESAKAETKNAAKSIRDEAYGLAGQARDKARDEAEQGKETVAGGLDDFAAAVRKASEELGSRDQSMASQVVREVAGGLEHASRTIHGKDIGELTQSVGRFARERPATFLVGAALAGLALGRFARSSDDHSEADYHSDQPVPSGLPNVGGTAAGAHQTPAPSSPATTVMPGSRPRHSSPMPSTPIGDQQTGGSHDR